MLEGNFNRFKTIKNEHSKLLHNKWKIYQTTEVWRLSEESQVAAARWGVTSVLCKKTVQLLNSKLLTEYLLMKAIKLYYESESLQYNQSSEYESSEYKDTMALFIFVMIYQMTHITILYC